MPPYLEAVIEALGALLVLVKTQIPEGSKLIVARLLLEFEQLRCLIDSKLQQVNNSCNCNGDCNCEKDKSPVYCVKNYTL